MACGSRLFIALFRSRRSLHITVLALQHQMAVYQRAGCRPRPHPTDRLLWAWLSRLWTRWQEALIFVQRRTVIAWQRKRSREHWRRLSQSRTPGCPAISQDVQEPIREMSKANPIWGAPRLVGELRKLCIDIAKSTVEAYRVRPQVVEAFPWDSAPRYLLRDRDHSYGAQFQQRVRHKGD